MELGKEIPRKEFNKWVTALYKGKYPKGTGQLQSSKGYCCLGVAQREVCKKPEQDAYGRLSGGYPAAPFNSPEWLTMMDKDFREKSGQRLSSLNDKEGFTHQEIAMLLELVYVYKMLD